MKKGFTLSMLISISLIGITQNVTLTVPDYSYGQISAEYGTATSSGVANPGPYGKKTWEEDQRPSGVYFAHGYRWWGYGSLSLGCGPYPEFNFPGDHGIYELAGTGCSNPSSGFMGSWGGVVIEPASRTIWCLLGAEKNHGPTKAYCIPNPYGPGEMCYGIPSVWGRGASYGYLRKFVVIKSSGSLQKGDPVNIKVKLAAKRTKTGDGTILCQGILMMNREGNPFEYMRWSDVSDFSTGPMDARLYAEQGMKDSATVVLAIGDTIEIEMAFNNAVSHDHPGTYSEGTGWAGQIPSDLFDEDYVRTDSVKKIVKKYGNSLTYDLLCLTPGAVFESVTADGKNLDEDKDGISDAREKGADGSNSAWDGDGDAIPDYKQANAASFLTYDKKNYVTLVVPAGMVLSQMKVTANPSPSDTPADAEFPYGFFDFSIDGLDPGEAVNVTLILHNATSIDKYYKYGPTPDNITPHWYDFAYNGQTGAVINGNVITLHFVDGLRGDEDLTVNASIKEPGGPAIAGTTGIPELIEKSGILVYPNPSTVNVTLRLVNILPGDDYLLNIHSNTGNIIQQKLINVCDANEEFVISTYNLPSGIYLITLSGSNRVYKKKFVKLN